MIAAGPSNPQWVSLALRRRLGLPVPSGLAMVFHTSGYRFAALGPFRRPPTRGMPRIASVLLNMSASVGLVGG